MYVCNCRGITESEVRVKANASPLNKLVVLREPSCSDRASCINIGRCGKCITEIQEIVREERNKSTPSSQDT